MPRDPLGVLHTNNIICCLCSPEFFKVTKGAKYYDSYGGKLTRSSPITTNNPPITSKILGQSPSNHLWNTTSSVMPWYRKSRTLPVSELTLPVPSASFNHTFCWQSFTMFHSSPSFHAQSVFPICFRVCSVFCLYLRIGLVYCFRSRLSFLSLAAVLMIELVRSGCLHE